MVKLHRSHALSELVPALLHTQHGWNGNCKDRH